MLGFLAPLLGGLGGLLFPAAGAAATGAAATGISALLSKAALPALGAGLGTLVSGGGGKDAIRNALMMGVGVSAFPGLAKNIQGSGFGQSITEGLASIFGEKPQQAPPTLPLSMGRAQPEQVAPEMAMGMTDMEGGARRTPIPTTIPTISDMSEYDPGMRYISDMTDYEVRRDRSGGIPAELPPMRPEYNMIDPEFLTMLMPGYYDDSRIRRPFAMGGEIEGPGTGTSDSIPATIYQDGKPVQKAALSDGEFVMTADAVKGAGNGNRERGVNRMYELMRRFESGEMV
jgi:hypothetical protein